MRIVEVSGAPLAHVNVTACVCMQSECLHVYVCVFLYLCELVYLCDDMGEYISFFPALDM